MKKIRHMIERDLVTKIEPFEEDVIESYGAVHRDGDYCYMCGFLVEKREKLRSHMGLFIEMEISA